MVQFIEMVTREGLHWIGRVARLGVITHFLFRLQPRLESTKLKLTLLLCHSLLSVLPLSLLHHKYRCVCESKSCHAINYRDLLCSSFYYAFFGHTSSSCAIQNCGQSRMFTPSTSVTRRIPLIFQQSLITLGTELSVRQRVWIHV